MNASQPDGDRHDAWPKLNRAVPYAFFAAFVLLAGAISSAETITLTPVADTTLSQTYPENNFGAMPFFNSGTTQNSNRNRGLLKFDLAAALPRNARLFSAMLTLEVVGVPNEDFPSARFNLHRVLQPWSEGSGTNTLGGGLGQGSLAATNEATWTHRFAFTPETWSQPGAAVPADFASIASSGVTVSGADQSPYTILSSPQLVADLQLWLDVPETNHGWLLLCQQETTKFTARRFGSREDAFNTPRLEIDFLVQPTIEATTKAGDQFGFTFAARIGHSYFVEFRDSFTNGDWQNLTNTGLINEATNVLVTDLITSTQRCYRVRAH